jgi:hypothetical protein
MVIKKYQHFPFQGPPKFTQIAIFGLKINHLATLLRVSALQFFGTVFLRQEIHISKQNTLFSCICFFK